MPHPLHGEKVKLDRDAREGSLYLHKTYTIEWYNKPNKKKQGGSIMRKQTAVTLLAISILLLAVVSFVLVRQIDTGTSGLFPSQNGRMPEMGMNPNMGMGG